MEIASIKKSNQKDIITQTIKVLKSKGLVIFPSDTVYGLLADATNKEAVKKLISFKNRPASKPISVFVEDFKMIEELVDLDKQTKEKLEQLFPGPFTVVLKSKHKISKLLESEKGTLGVRIPNFPLVTEIVRKFGRPITATSANISGKSPHYSIESLMKQLSQKKKQLIDLIIDGGKLPRNKPSTIIDLTTPTLKIVRKGDIVFKDTQTFISQSPTQTKKVGEYILKKNQKSKSKDQKPLIFIIEGELGVGKTIFIKGIGEALEIFDIVSPTFVVYYEYKIRNAKFEIRNSKFIHVDLYNLQEDEEFEHLGLENYLKPGNILAFEWGEKAGKIFQTLKQKGKIIYIKMSYKNEKEREMRISKI